DHAAPPRLRDEKDLARGLPALERAMRLSGLRQRELVLDAQLDLPVLDPAQDFTRPLDQLLARADVVVEARPLQEERAPHVDEDHAAPPRLRDEKDLARGLPALERAMRLSGLRQRELVLDAQLDLPVLDPAQDFTRPLDQLLARADVVVEARPLQEERAPHVD